MSRRFQTKSERIAELEGKLSSAYVELDAWRSQFGMQLSHAVAEFDQQCKELAACKAALDGALVLADCLADTKDDPDSFRGNNDNYMRIVDAIKSTQIKSKV